MLPKVHFVVAVIVSIILFLVGWQWWQLALFFVAAFFIDVDHYFWFICNKGSWSLPRAYKYLVHLSKIKRKGTKYVHHLLVFHTIETFIVLLVLSFVWFNIFFPLLLGFIVHYSLDLAYGSMHREKKYKSRWSLITNITKNAKR